MRRLSTFLAIAAVALGVSACGNKEAETLHGATEGSYLDLGGMKYQVQISRQLNPASVEDRDYLVGIPQGQRQPAPGQEWFAVFMRVENDGEKPSRAATDYRITDTQGNRFTPVRIGGENVFVYRGGRVMQPTDILPDPDSAPGQGSIQGSMLLFKIPTRDLENRPLELSIRTPSAPGKVATVDLDV